MREDLRSVIKYSIIVTLLGTIISLIFFIYELNKGGSTGFWANILVVNLVIMLINLYHLDK